jgi:hypothetical protein
MTKEDEGKTIKVIYVDTVDKCRAIQVGDLGEIESYEYGIPRILFKTGLARGSLYFMDRNQLRVMNDDI